MKVRKFVEKNKSILYIIGLVLMLSIGFLYYFLFVKINPNDKILTTSDGVALFANENPSFMVQFGNREDESKQWVRFEATPSNSNPFERDTENIFTTIINFFKPKERVGIEMSLVGVKLSETSTSQYDEEIQSVSDILGAGDVSTTTKLASVGQVFGEESEEAVSKQTIINEGVSEGVNLEYQIMNGLGLKEEIIINNLASYNEGCEENCSLPLNEYTFELKLDQSVSLKSGWYTIDGKSTEIYYFVDSDGRYLAHFLPSYAVDNIGSRTNNVQLKVEEDDGGDYKITVVVDIDWLMSEDRIYPIRIDPSIIHDDSSDFSSGTFNGSTIATGPKIQTSVFYCSGGTVTSVGGYRIHTFTATGTFSCIGSSNVEVLVVGGGGGGGGGGPSGGGGGGGGGIQYNASFAVSSSTNYTATIGTGGSGGNQAQGSNGQNSSFSTITANGGGGGGAGATGTQTGANGGSGGGGGGTGGSGTNAGGTGSQGYDGGTTGSAAVAGAGGGGGGEKGLASSGDTGGRGGNGYISSISGISAYYAGGGGAGCRYSDGVPSSGGSGGGGNGSARSTVGSNGTANTGGGGGGSGAYSTGGTGGSGIIIIRYKPLLLGSSEYLSPALELGITTSRFDLSWLVSGASTTNGETPYSTTGLVAQWDFNETSGTTAVSGGTCSTSCNGTLTNFASTGSQDASAGSGWTADNRRWGAGALMLDGSNDYVSVSSTTSTTSFTIGAWIKYIESSTTQIPIGGSNALDYFFGNTAGVLTNSLRNAGGTQIQCNATALMGWHYYTSVVSVSGSDVTWNIYTDGALSNTCTSSGGLTIFTINNFGRGGASSAVYFNGILDSIALYSRALTAGEVLSNYNSGSVEFLLRGGNSSTPNDGSWGNWATTSNETSINAFDSGLLYGTTDTGLISYWSLNESSGTSLADSKGSNTISATGTTVFSGRFSNGRKFNGTSDYISCTDANCGGTSAGKLDYPGSGGWTIEAWVNPSSVNSAAHPIVAKDQTGLRSSYLLSLGSDNKFHLYKGGGGCNVDGTSTAVAGQWYHLVATYDGSTTAKLYVNGVLEYTQSSCAAFVDNAAPFTIGQATDGYFAGTIDEVRIFSTALSATAIQTDYMQGTSVGNLLQSSSTIASVGTASNRITNTLNSGLVAYWPLDESYGTSIIDTVGGNTGTVVSGTSVVSGKYSLARSFSGSSGVYVSVNDAAVLKPTTALTIDVWIMPTSSSNLAGASVVCKGNGTAEAYCLDFPTANTLKPRFFVRSGASTYAITATSALTVSTWNHIVAVYGSSYIYLYINGTLNTSTAASASIDTNTHLLSIGCRQSASSTYDMCFNGYIDELKFYNTAQDAVNIYAEYIASKAYYTNHTFSSTDLSGMKSVPIYIASDKIGSAVSIMLGESPYVNYQPDANTTLLLHLDEMTGSSAYLKDSSGRRNDGTPVSTTFTTSGKFSGARSFGGSSDYITIPNSPAPGSTLTIDAWVKINTANAGTIYSWGPTTGCNPSSQYMVVSSSKVAFTTGCGTTLTSSHALVTGVWTHVALTIDGSGNATIYINGQKDTAATNTRNGQTVSTGNDQIGVLWSGGSRASYFNGYIDEVRVSNAVRTADQIRQSYEAELRTHNVNILFGASLSSSNLIANSGDTSFTIDATKKGLAQMGTGLYVGDKVIVKETSSGTDYIAQGVVTAINETTGATTVNSWDAASTFPGSGFTVAATVFKWQREYIPMVGRSLSTQFDAVSVMTVRVANSYNIGSVWIDDLKSNGGYVTTSGTEVDLGTGYSYVQYKAIFSSSTSTAQPYISQVQLDYTSMGPTLEQLMKHGMWLDSSGGKHGFWWINN